MVTLFVKGQLNHMVKILAVKFLFVRSRRQNRRSLRPPPAIAARLNSAGAAPTNRRSLRPPPAIAALLNSAAVHGCKGRGGAHVHTAVLDLKFPIFIPLEFEFIGY
jgi:hypothetical protein